MAMLDGCCECRAVPTFDLRSACERPVPVEGVQHPQNIKQKSNAMPIRCADAQKNETRLSRSWCTCMNGSEAAPLRAAVPWHPAC